VLEGTHRTRRPAGQLGHRLDGQVGHEAEDNDVALIGGPASQGIDEFPVQRIGPRRGSGDFGHGLIGAAGPAGGPPAGVDEAAAGDGEDPPSQAVVVTVEPAQVPHDMEEDLTERVLGIFGTGTAEVAEHGRGQGPVHVAGITAAPGPVNRAIDRRQPGAPAGHGGAAAGDRSVDPEGRRRKRGGHEPESAFAESPDFPEARTEFEWSPPGVPGAGR